MRGRVILFKIEIPIDDRIEKQSRKENPMKKYKEIDNTVICEWKLVHLGFCVESTHALMINNWAYLFKKIFIDTLFLWLIILKKLKNFWMNFSIKRITAKSTCYKIWCHDILICYFFLSSWLCAILIYLIQFGEFTGDCVVGMIRKRCTRKWIQNSRHIHQCNPEWKNDPENFFSLTKRKLITSMKYSKPCRWWFLHLASK